MLHMAMSEEEILVAQLAATSQGYMNNLTRGSNDDSLRGNRTDWRRFLKSDGRRPNGLPPQGYYPQQPSGFDMPPDPEYGDVPQEVSSQIRQYAVPNLSPELQAVAGIQPQQTIPGGLNITGFNIPAYGSSATSNPSNNTAFDEKLDYLVKEIKLLKRSVNTLTNLLKKSILSDGIQPTDNKPQSVITSEDTV